MKNYILFIVFIFYSSLAVAADCPEGTYYVVSHFRSDYTRKDGTYVKAAQVKDSCRQYTFFKPLKLFFNQKMSNGWPNRNEKFVGWNEKEKKEIDEILKTLPAALTQVGDLKLARAIDSKWKGNAATAAPDGNIITIYNSAFSVGLKKVITHELAHILWKNIDQSNREKYFDSAEWVLNSEGEVANQRAIISEEDGRSSPEEDFANNLEHLITNKYYSKKVSPKIIECLKIILGIKNEK